MNRKQSKSKNGRYDRYEHLDCGSETVTYWRHRDDKRIRYAFDPAIDDVFYPATNADDAAGRLGRYFASAKEAERFCQEHATLCAQSVGMRLPRTGWRWVADPPPHAKYGNRAQIETNYPLFRLSCFAAARLGKAYMWSVFNGRFYECAHWFTTQADAIDFIDSAEGIEITNQIVKSEVGDANAKAA